MLKWVKQRPYDAEEILYIKAHIAVLQSLRNEYLIHCVFLSYFLSSCLVPLHYFFIQFAHLSSFFLFQSFYSLMHDIRHLINIYGMKILDSTKVYIVTAMMPWTLQEALHLYKFSWRKKIEIAKGVINGLQYLLENQVMRDG